MNIQKPAARVMTNNTHWYLDKLANFYLFCWSGENKETKQSFLYCHTLVRSPVPLDPIPIPKTKSKISIGTGAYTKITWTTHPTTFNNEEDSKNKDMG